MNIIKILVLLLFTTQLLGQYAESQPPFTKAEERLAAFEQRMELKEKSLVQNVAFTNIGPTVFSGRVSEIAVSPDDPTHFYVAYASGGLWKTTNNGMSFQPIFDKETVMTLGAVEVDWKNNTIWVGTGEVNSSRSSYAGVGLYKSSDDGKTWQHAGLSESHHIGRIVLHPTDPNTLWVAVLGHLYSTNEERGIYKTTDGGKTWNKTLYVNDNTGAVDLLMDPKDSQTLYAAMWERSRSAWNFVEAGEGSGLYKSTDGGASWKQLNTAKSGFPVGEGVGRIGLAMTYEKKQPVLYAILDNYDRRPEEEKEDEEELLTKDDLRAMSKEDFLKLEEDQLKTFLSSNGFPKKYSAEKVMEMIEKEEIKPLALVEYLEDANSLLFDTPVIGAEVYKSTNGGKTWNKTHDKYLDAVYNSYGYYFGQIRVAPDNSDKIYILGVPVLRSDDGGENWESMNAANVHSDHHELWSNPNRPGHLILGNDGGINISYDDGETWNKCNTPPVGQFYAIAVDMDEPYNVYGGLQDNGVWMGPNTYSASRAWEGNGQYPYKRIMGGDGMQVAVDTRDNATVYTGYQFGNYFRLNTKTGDRKYITPKHELGERPLRWNWQTPVHLSLHNQDILYMGANKLFRSFNQGDDFEAISPDLTTGGKKGDVAFSTLTTIHESPLKFGLIYVGTDDGQIHVTRNGGYSWTKITDGLPKDMWITKVQASQHEEGTVYASLNGYRWDDFAAYVYQSKDYGKTWQVIGKDLPTESVNVIKEDPVNPDLLYVGTDHGLYVSLNGGTDFMLMDKDLPAVAVHDLIVHPVSNDLIVGTHGRSIYKTSVAEVQQLTEEMLAKSLHLFAVAGTRHSTFWGRSRAWWGEAFEPETAFAFYSDEADKVQLTITPAEDEFLVLASWEVEATKGLNYTDYDFSMNEAQVAAFEQWKNEKMDDKEKEKAFKLKQADNEKYYLPKGKYSVTIKRVGEEAKEELVLK